MYVKIVNLGRYTLEDITARAKRDVDKVFIYLKDGFLTFDERVLKLEEEMIEITTDMYNDGGLCLERGRMEASIEKERSVKYDVDNMIRTEVMPFLDYEIYRVSKYIHEEGKALTIDKNGNIYLREHHKSLSNPDNDNKRKAFAGEMNSYVRKLLDNTIIKPNFRS